MTSGLNHLRRYELKYTVTEAQAREIREYIQPLFSLDEHASREQRGYLVNNLYLDTPGLRFYHDTKFRQETRFKPRVRYYGSQPEDFVVLEVKHRHNTVSWKTRREIAARDWPEALDVSMSTAGPPVYAASPQTFEQVNHLYSTIPVLHVRYFREPYVSDIDEYGRITFDRGLRYRLAHGSPDLGGGDEGMTYYGDQASYREEDSPVVLEIKTGTSVPVWTVELVRRYSLVQRGFSKYCYVIDACLEGGCDERDLTL